MKQHTQQLKKLIEDFVSTIPLDESPSEESIKELINSIEELYETNHNA